MTETPSQQHPPGQPAGNLHDVKFDAGSYRSRRGLARWGGWAAVIIGIFLIADALIAWPLKIPPVLKVLSGVVSCGVGWSFLSWLTKLPIREALLVGRQRGNVITPTVLVEQLGIEPEMARHTVKAIEVEGLGDSELNLKAAEKVAQDLGISSSTTLPEMDQRVKLRS